MNIYLRNRFICIGLFFMVNLVYGALVITGAIGTTTAGIYGVAGLLWAGKLQMSRNQYRRKVGR